MKPRRSQTAVNIRSDKAAALLGRMTGPGRSQVAVIEDALDQMYYFGEAKAQSFDEVRAQFSAEPQFNDEKAEEIYRKILEISERASKLPHRFASMAAFDAHEYDERGNPR